jgi:hypothetical protein
MPVVPGPWVAVCIFLLTGIFSSQTWIVVNVFTVFELRAPFQIVVDWMHAIGERFSIGRI